MNMTWLQQERDCVLAGFLGTSKSPASNKTFPSSFHSSWGGKKSTGQKMGAWRWQSLLRTAGGSLINKNAPIVVRNGCRAAGNEGPSHPKLPSQNDIMHFQMNAFCHQIKEEQVHQPQNYTDLSHHQVVCQERKSFISNNQQMTNNETSSR